MLLHKKIAPEARKKVLTMIYKAQTSHIGSCFSVIDILTVLFEKADLSKDKIILSAGWKAAAFYYFLARKGIIPKSALDTYCMTGSKYIGLTEPGIPGVLFAGGSMGMGLPAAVGFALAKKMKKEDGAIYVIMSDGEMQCGTTWESALIAPHHKLNNLVVIVDYNKFQAMGKINEILNIEPLADKWRTFGWGINVLNEGNNCEDIDYCLGNLFKPSIPQVIIAHTIKGKGVSFMENNNLWHYKAPDKNEFELTMSELNL